MENKTIGVVIPSSLVIPSETRDLHLACGQNYRFLAPESGARNDNLFRDALNFQHEIRGNFRGADYALCA